MFGTFLIEVTTVKAVAVLAEERFKEVPVEVGNVVAGESGDSGKRKGGGIGRWN